MAIELPLAITLRLPASTCERAEPHRSNSSGTRFELHVDNGRTAAVIGMGVEINTSGIFQHHAGQMRLITLEPIPAKQLA